MLLFKKVVFCAEFFALQHIKIWKWRFFDIESHESRRNVKLKKTHYFYRNPMYSTIAKSSGAGSEDRSGQLQISSMFYSFKICCKGCTLLH